MRTTKLVSIHLSQAILLICVMAAPAIAASAPSESERNLIYYGHSRSDEIAFERIAPDDEAWREPDMKICRDFESSVDKSALVAGSSFVTLSPNARFKRPDYSPLEKDFLIGTITSASREMGTTGWKDRMVAWVEYASGSGRLIAQKAEIGELTIIRYLSWSEPTIGSAGMGGQTIDTSPGWYNFFVLNGKVLLTNRSIHEDVLVSDEQEVVVVSDTPETQSNQFPPSLPSYLNKSYYGTLAIRRVSTDDNYLMLEPTACIFRQRIAN